MTDSDAHETLEAKHERNRAARIESIKRWVRHIRETPPEHWGPEQNAVVDAQVEAARSADVDAAHLARVEQVAREIVEETDR